MHPIISRILGVSVKAWRAEVADIEKKLGRIRSAAVPATTHAVRLAEAVAAFDAAPSLERCQTVIDLKIQEDGAFFVEQHVRDAIISQRQELLAATKPKFLAAVEELRAGLEKSAAEIRAHDREQTELMGEIIESTAPLAAIARRLAQLDSAVSLFARDSVAAGAILSGVIG
jgi:hypothetical protein